MTNIHIIISKYLRLHIIFIFLFVSFAFSAQAQQNRRTSIYQDTVTVNDGEITTMTISLKGKKLAVIRLKEGKKEGLQEKYGRNGTLAEESTYKNGNLEGKFIKYNYSGKIIEEKFYKYNKSRGHSLLQGSLQKFNNQYLLVLANYKDSLLHGDYKEYKRDMLFISAKYKAGLLIGSQTKYNRNGIISAKENYKIISENGIKKSVLNGKITYYNSQGFVSSEGVYKNGNKDGVWKTYYQGKGALESVITYKKGKKNGEFTYYYQNGNVKSRGTQYSQKSKYPYVIFDGKHETFNRNGNTTIITNYDMGNRHGDYKRFYDGGSIMESGEYYQKLKNGIWYYFSPEGDTLSLISYKVIPKDTIEVSVKDGPEIRWKNRTIVSKQFWKESKMHGEQQNYFPNGKLASKYNYNNGLLEGEYITYHQNGVMESYKFYKIRELYNNTEKAFAVGWDYRYDKEGSMTAKYYRDSLEKTIASISYKENFPAQVDYPGIIKIGYFPDGKIRSINMKTSYYSVFDQYYYRNGNTRLINIQNPENNVNNQIVYSNTGDVVYCSSRNKNPDSLQPSANIISKYTNAVGLKFIDNKFYSDSIKDGKYTLLYSNGNIMCELGFKNDLPHGNFVVYDAVSGDSLCYTSYNNGIIGYYMNKFAGKRYTQRGQLAANGKEMWVEYYYPNGNLREKSVYSKDNTSRIEHIEFWQNGQLKTKNNTIIGSSESYANDGRISSQTIVKDSLKTYRSYFANSNQLRTENFYINNKKEGLWKTYYESGQLWYKLSYKNGLAEGQYIQYFKDGKPKFVGDYKDNIKVGKWLHYNEYSVDTVSYKNGKIVVKMPDSKCGCVDTTISKISYASSLYHLCEYEDFKHFMPDFIIPIDSLEYRRIMYNRLQASDGGYSMDLVLFDYLSLKIPADEQIKITLNPCKTPGFISQMHMSAHIEGRTPYKSVTLNPKRISMEFLKGPLKSADSNYEYFTALFDTKSINYRNGKKLSFSFAKDQNACFSKGIINNFLQMEVINAKPHLFNMPSYYPLELTKNELSHFFGIKVNEARLSFYYQQNNARIKLDAKSDFILAGGHLAAGKIQISCKQITEDSYQIGEDGNDQVISAKELKNQWMANGFSRMQTSYDNNKQALIISFFVK